jgi:hypothetical protein
MTKCISTFGVEDLFHQREFPPRHLPEYSEMLSGIFHPGTNGKCMALGDDWNFPIK